MPYNFAAESFHTKKLCSSRLSSRKVHVLYGKLKKIRLWGPLWGLVATYAVHLRLIGKLVGDFLLVIIELFFATCFRFVTIHACDRRTDRRMAWRSPRRRLHTMQRGKTVNEGFLNTVPISEFPTACGKVGSDRRLSQQRCMCLIEDAAYRCRIWVAAEYRCTTNFSTLKLW